MLEFADARHSLKSASVTFSASVAVETHASQALVHASKLVQLVLIPAVVALRTGSAKNAAATSPNLCSG